MANIWRSKNNQAMKCGQLIVYNMTKVFLKNHVQNMVEKLIPDTFLEMQNWVYLWISCVKFNTAYFYCMSSWGLSKLLKLSCRSLASTSKKVFLKNKKKSVTSLPALFSARFIAKSISLVIFYYLPNFIIWFFLLREILGNMCIAIVC